MYNTCVSVFLLYIEHVYVYIYIYTQATGFHRHKDRFGLQCVYHVASKLVEVISPWSKLYELLENDGGGVDDEPESTG